MLGGVSRQEILSLVKQQDAYTKYINSEKGKIARKKSNDNYYARHGKPQKGDASDVLRHLNKYFADMFCKDTGCLSNEEYEKFDPMRYRTGTDLWHAYCESGCPKMTRVRYISLLPELKTTNWFMRDGIKVYTLAYIFDLNDYDLE